MQFYGVNEIRRLSTLSFFHTAGLSFPYKTCTMFMSQGNAFYEKRSRDGSLQIPTDNRPYDVAYAFAQERSGYAPSFIDEGLESKEVKAEKSASPSTEVAQSKTVQPTSFAMVQLDKVPIPTYAPKHLARKEENKTIMALPSSDQLNAIVAMLEKRHRNW